MQQDAAAISGEWDWSGKDIVLTLRPFSSSLAGVSRSVTVTAAYIMTVTNLGWRDALNSIRGARSVANPNFGFQKQLQNYENEQLEEVKI